MRKDCFMGQFLNKGNRKFAEFSKTKYFVDKSELINKLLEKDITEKFICCSRARRFGKSVTADMLVAYFSKGVDSKELFEPLGCVKDELFRSSMNHYDTIFMDIQAQFEAAFEKNEDPLMRIRKSVAKELRAEYPEIVSDDDIIADALFKIYDQTGSQFVIIFDEWDYPVREFPSHSAQLKKYIDFLRSLFKNSDAKEYIRLAYLTGIMPIIRTKGQSAINNFTEYTMLHAGDLGTCIGFTEKEVMDLCERSGTDFTQMKEWYDGYMLGQTSMYNPLSVIKAITNHDFTQYWTATGTYEDISELINQNFDGLREAVIQMLSGNRIPVQTLGGKNDLRTFVNKDEVITALIHLGYFGYDKNTKEAYVPNKEIREVFYHYMENNRNDNLSLFLNQSERILNCLMEKEEAEAAMLIQNIHNDFVSSIAYNDENSLACTITTTLVSSFAYYHKPIREFPCGKGFADLVYLPLSSCPNRPVIVAELKWNLSAEAAIAQIKNRQYPESLKEYAGEILLVGIDYDKRTKEHRCKIEMHVSNQYSTHNHI